MTQITQSGAENRLIKMANEHEFIYKKWIDKPFGIFKFASTTEKGDLGEDFLANLLRDCNCQVKVISGRRGHYDVSAKHNNKEIKFEVKVATLDTNNSFQFNGIRHDTRYTHLFCLGISPDNIGYLIVNKRELNSDEHPLVSMAKGSNATFKLTKSKDKLKKFDSFENDVKKLFE